MSGEREGWVYIWGARKWQYVRKDGRSLCGRWLYMGSAAPRQDNDGSVDNCTACRKKLERIRAAERGSRADGGRDG